MGRTAPRARRAGRPGAAPVPGPLLGARAASARERGVHARRHAVSPPTR